MNAPLVDEREVVLMMGGTISRLWRCTPTDVEALVIGRLFIEGLITRADDVHLTIEPSAEGILVAARAADDAMARMHAPPPRTLPIPAQDAFSTLFRTLFQTVDARYEHGGMHATAATDGTRIVRQVEDVGRHNTIDKIVGVLLLADQQPGDYGLLTSSRVSGEIAHKAVRAGFAWLASRSIPTTLAVRIANAAHMPIIGRAAGKDAYVYR